MVRAEDVPGPALRSRSSAWRWPMRLPTPSACTGWSGALRRLREAWVVWRDGGFAAEEGELSAEAAEAEPERMLRGYGIALAEGDRVEISPARRRYEPACRARAAARLRPRHRLWLRGPRALFGSSPGGTVRAYRGHTVSDDPFAHVGVSRTLRRTSTSAPCAARARRRGRLRRADDAGRLPGQPGDGRPPRRSRPKPDGHPAGIPGGSGGNAASHRSRRDGADSGCW